MASSSQFIKLNGTKKSLHFVGVNGSSKVLEAVVDETVTDRRCEAAVNDVPKLLLLEVS